MPQSMITLGGPSRNDHFHPGAQQGCRRRPGVEPVWRPEVSQLPAGMVADAGRRQVGDRDAETATEILGGCVDAQIVDGGPQIELRSGRVATEAAVTMAAEMDGEDPALRPAVAMDRAWAAQARTTAGRGHEAQQVQAPARW